jgi:hypothetical protein
MTEYLIEFNLGPKKEIILLHQLLGHHLIVQICSRSRIQKPIANDQLVQIVNMTITSRDSK